MGYLNSWGLDKLDDKQLIDMLDNIQKTAKNLISDIDSSLEKSKKKEVKKTPLQEKIAQAKSQQKSGTEKKEVEKNDLFKSKTTNS